MPEPLRPLPAKAYLRENWIFIPTIASAALAPTVAEATGASALDFTNMVFADAAPSPEQNTELVEQERRLGDAGLFQSIGPTTYTGGQITAAFNQQGIAAADDVKFWEKFSAGGITGFLAYRLNVAKAAAIVAGQFLDVYPCEFGPLMPVKQGQGAGAEGAVRGSWAVTSQPKFKIAVLA